MVNKKFFILLIFFLFLSFNIFATELTYPDIENTLSPGQATSTEGIVLYVVNLLLIVTIGLTVGSFIFSGVFYIISQVPNAKNNARKWITRSLLGVLISVSGYLLLVTINPQIILKSILEIKKIPSSIPIVNSVKEADIVYVQSAVGTEIEEILDYIGEEITLEEIYKLDEESTAALEDDNIPTTGEKVEGALTILGDTRTTIHRLEIPILEIIYVANEASVLTTQLKGLLADCRCGTSKWHAEKKDAFNTSCVGGEEGEDKGCESRCENCGEELDPNSGKLICDLDLILEKREKLKLALADLQAQKIKLSSEQTIFIDQILSNNASRFMVQNFEGSHVLEDFLSLQENFDDIKLFQEELDEEDINKKFDIDIQHHSLLPEKPKGVTLSPLSPDPFTFYTAIVDPYSFYPGTIISENARIYKEAQRISLFSVLSGLSLQQIQNMIQGCLNQAFGSGTFIMSAEKMEEIVKTAMEEGLVNYLVDFMASEDDAKEYANELLDDIDEEMKKEMADERQKAILECKTKCSGGDNDCLDKCNDALPPDFLSKKLVGLLTVNIQDQLPSEIKKVLESELRKVIFSNALNDVLTMELGDVLSKAMNGALSESFANMVPGLRTALNKKMSDVMPDMVLNPVQDIDFLLSANLKRLKKRIDEGIGDLAKELGERLSQPIINFLEGYKEDHPSQFREKSSPEDCWDMFMDGYYYIYKDRTTCDTDPKDNNCKKIEDPSIIKDGVLLSVIGEDIEHAESCGHFDRNTSGFSVIENYCRDVGFCWSNLNDECEECAWIDFSNLAPTRDNFKRAAGAVVSGLVNFTEQFVVALTQTAVYTMTKYTQVWIEDSLIVPFQPYLNQMASLQKQIRKFLSTSVGAFLPTQINNYLYSNLQGIISLACADLKNGKNPQIGGAELNLGSDAEKILCNMDSFLHTTIMEELEESGELGKNIVNGLETKVNALFGKEVQNVLNSSFASMLFPGVDGIEAALTATTKELICGEVSFSNTTLARECKKQKDTKATGGLWPYPKEGTTIPFTNSDGGVGWGYGNWNYCAFVWYACETPFANMNKPIGPIIELLATSQCKIADKESQKTCGGKECIKCNEQESGGCFFCNTIVNRSIFFSLLNSLIQSSYQDIEYENPDQAREIYKWLFYTFTSDAFRQNIYDLSIWRGLQPTEWAIIQQEVQNGITQGELDTMESAAHTLIAWFVAENKTVKQAFTSPCMGFVEQYTGKKCNGRNFLAYSPYMILQKGVCYEIKDTFKKEMIKASDDPTYEVSSDLTAQYNLCQALNNTVADSIGIGDNMINYVRPPEYKILFKLMRDELKSTERPQLLNDILDTLYENTPVGLLYDAGKKYNNEEAVYLAEFLGSNLGSKINVYPVNQPLIVLIFEALDKIGLVDKNVLNQRLNLNTFMALEPFLIKTPIQLIGMLEMEVLNDPRLNASLMSFLEQHINVLNLNYIDFLGSWPIDITGTVASFTDTLDNFEGKVNKSVKKNLKKIQNTFDTVALEYPMKGIQWLVGELGGLVGSNTASSSAAQVAGSCRPANAIEVGNQECRDTTGKIYDRESKDEVYNRKSKECCTLGGDLVCTPRCRIMGPEETTCKVEIGEEQMGNQCCFNGCRTCREVPEGVDECKRAKEAEYSSTPEKVMKDGIEINICCSERTTKGESCCINVVECVSDKFTKYLELIGINMIGGLPVNTDYIE